MKYKFNKEDELFRQELRSWIRNEIHDDFNTWQGIDEAGEDFP